MNTGRTHMRGLETTSATTCSQVSGVILTEDREQTPPRFHWEIFEGRDRFMQEILKEDKNALMAEAESEE